MEPEYRRLSSVRIKAEILSPPWLLLMSPAEIDEAVRNLGENSELSLAKQFFNYAALDFQACSTLRSSQNKAAAVFHLQQGIEKTAKAMLILDHTTEGLKRLDRSRIRTHNFLELLQNSIRISDYFATRAQLDSVFAGKGVPKLEETYADKGLFRYALEYASRELVEFAKLGSKIYGSMSFEEIVKRSGDTELRFWNEELRDKKQGESRAVILQHLKKEEVFVGIMRDKDAQLRISHEQCEEISDLMKRVKELCQIDRVMPIFLFASIFEAAELERMRRSMEFWAETYVPILFLVLLSAPHEVCSRYPDSDIDVNLVEYERGSGLGIVEMLDVLLQEALAVENKVSARITSFREET
jgi:HEPN domain-containing protein